MSTALAEPAAPSGLNPASAAFAERLAARLPADTVRRAEDRHREELRRIARGTAEFVALPRSTEDVATIVRLCAEARVAVVPYGGGTGLVGGQLADGPPALTVSLQRMDKVRALHANEGSLTIEAGAVLENVHAVAEEAGLMFPLTLGAKGSARLGGLLAANAGGTAVLRYGTMRELTLGIEAVLPDGAVMQTHRLRKSNMGYDLRHLLIGSEGTLGIITAATLRLFPVPRERAAAFLEIGAPDDALELLALARERLGDGVSGCELVDGQGLEWLAEHLPETRQPFAQPPEWSVLIEAGLFEGSATEALEEIAGEAIERGIVRDGVVSRSESQREAFWAVRESIPEANRAIGPIASHDVSVPLSEVPRLIREGRRALHEIAPDIRFNTFGHVGDGNVHYNLFPAPGRTRDDYSAVGAALTARLHDMVAELGGAISAEHGIGRFKRDELVRLGDPSAVAAMRAIKSALDPMGIMNPGAVL